MSSAKCRAWKQFPHRKGRSRVKFRNSGSGPTNPGEQRDRLKHRSCKNHSPINSHSRDIPSSLRRCTNRVKLASTPAAFNALNDVYEVRLHAGFLSLGPRVCKPREKKKNRSVRTAFAVTMFELVLCRSRYFSNTRTRAHMQTHGMSDRNSLLLLRHPAE